MISVTDSSSTRSNAFRPPPAPRRAADGGSDTIMEVRAYGPAALLMKIWSSAPRRRPHDASPRATPEACGGGPRVPPRYRCWGRRSCACRPWSASSVVVADQCVDRVRRQPLRPPRNCQLDQEHGSRRSVPSEPGHQVANGPGGAAGGQQVVVHEHPGAAGERVDVDLERIDRILEPVLDTERLRAAASGLWRAGTNPAPSLARERPPRMKPRASAATTRSTDSGAAASSASSTTAPSNASGGDQQRRDVLEHDARPWVVGDSRM